MWELVQNSWNIAMFFFSSFLSLSIQTTLGVCPKQNNMQKLKHIKLGHLLKFRKIISILRFAERRVFTQWKDWSKWICSTMKWKMLWRENVIANEFIGIAWIVYVHFTYNPFVRSRILFTRKSTWIFCKCVPLKCKKINVDQAAEIAVGNFRCLIDCLRLQSTTNLA